MIPRTVAVSGSAGNEAKKKRSRMASLLKKAEELHRLHHLEVLVVLYDPVKDSLSHYCSTSAHQLFFSLLERISDPAFMPADNRPLPTPSSPACQPSFLLAPEPSPARLKAAPLDLELCSTKESSRRQESIKPPGSPLYLSPQQTNSTPERRKEQESDSESHRSLDWLDGV
jgi:hypothetical protein